MSDMSQIAPRFAALRNLSNADLSSEARRELLRQVTENLGAGGIAAVAESIAEFDAALASAAADYSRQVRIEIARMVASQSGLSRVAEAFAFDDIEVAAPILRLSSALSEGTLLKVVHGQSQDHLLAITKRNHVSENISEALVEKGEDHVVTSLLENACAIIGGGTYDRIAERARDSKVLQAPLVRRVGVPAELLNAVYLQADKALKHEILDKLQHLPAAEVEQALARSKARITIEYSRPADFRQSQKRIDTLARVGALKPATLVDLVREGRTSRTALKIAFARLTEMELDLVERVVEEPDIDTIALLCRGSAVERAVFVTLAVTLDEDPKRAMAAATQLMQLYDSVPPAAAERALRFWKVKAAA